MLTRVNRFMRISTKLSCKLGRVLLVSCLISLFIKVIIYFRHAWTSQARPPTEWIHVRPIQIIPCPQILETYILNGNTATYTQFNCYTRTGKPIITSTTDRATGVLNFKTHHDVLLICLRILSILLTLWRVYDERKWIKCLWLPCCRRIKLVSVHYRIQY